MKAFIAYVLRHPHTVAALLVLFTVLGVLAGTRMPVDILPDIDIPVVSVVWNYAGMSAQDMQDRIVTLHERQLAALVDDIERIEATCYQGVGVEKVYLHEGADVSRAVAQLGASAQVVLKYMPPNITPPLVLRYGATDVPLIQLSLSGSSATDTQLYDLGQNLIRPALAVVHGAQVPQPYGGKPRVIMADLDAAALSARGLSPADVSAALQRQNVILPGGDVRIGSIDYPLAVNNSTTLIDSINGFPIAERNGRAVYMRDVAHVHDGYQLQTNAVAVDGKPGALLSIRKTGRASVPEIIGGVRGALQDVGRLLPSGVKVTALFDQSLFVDAALGSVKLAGLMAGGLTALMIFLFLGNVRLTLLVIAAIPLSILFTILVLEVTGQTLNTMTLGGLALAVGILVDNSTVVIENIERHLAGSAGLAEAIVLGAGEVALPTSLATASICMVFLPVFLLQGAARYLFSPLALAVCVSLLISLMLSFTMVPVLADRLLRGTHAAGPGQPAPASGPRWLRAVGELPRAFGAAFERLREGYREVLAAAVVRPRLNAAVLMALGLALMSMAFALGRDFFPQVDAGQMRLHVRARPGTRLEQTRLDVARVEQAIRQIVGPEQVATLVDNIGLPYSGINLALSDTATVGTADGEVLIALTQRHTPTARLMSRLRRELPRRFPDLQFFFQPADIIDQILNFGAAAPIDVRVTGPDASRAYATARRIAAGMSGIPGVVDSHVQQVPDAPTINVRVDRDLAQQFGAQQLQVASDLLIATSGSAQLAPNFWVDPASHVSYPLVLQAPAYHIDSPQNLWALPVGAARGGGTPLLGEVAQFSRGQAPAVVSQINLRSVYDVNADVQGRTLSAAAADIDHLLHTVRGQADKRLSITLSGQVETMQHSYAGLFAGMAAAVGVVYLFLVINFQSWIAPLIILSTVPFALGGAATLLFLTGTALSVPALLGTLMCLGLSTANSILVVTFANSQRAHGHSAAEAAIAAGVMRMRPVLMTAGAMVLGMIPMALGVGEGGEQNAPLARAVIGGLLAATAATLLFVPLLYRILTEWRQSREAPEHSLVPHH